MFCALLTMYKPYNFLIFLQILHVVQCTFPWNQISLCTVEHTLNCVGLKPCLHNLQKFVFLGWQGGTWQACGIGLCCVMICFCNSIWPLSAYQVPSCTNLYVDLPRISVWGGYFPEDKSMGRNSSFAKHPLASYSEGLKFMIQSVFGKLDNISKPI